MCAQRIKIMQQEGSRLARSIVYRHNNNNNSSGYALAMWPSTSHLVYRHDAQSMVCYRQATAGTPTCSHTRIRRNTATCPAMQPRLLLLQQRLPAMKVFQTESHHDVTDTHCLQQWTKTQKFEPTPPSHIQHSTLWVINHIAQGNKHQQQRHSLNTAACAEHNTTFLSSTQLRMAGRHRWWQSWRPKGCRCAR
jgi:hypothetical protein